MEKTFSINMNVVLIVVVDVNYSARGFYSAHYIDIRSTYASVMASELLPNVQYAYYYQNGAKWEDYFKREKEGGIFQVIVKAPRTRIPVLPYMYNLRQNNIDWFFRVVFFVVIITSPN